MPRTCTPLQRLALSTLFLVAACNLDRNRLGPDGTVSGVFVTPDTVMLDPLQAFQFHVFGRGTAGDTLSVNAAWSATAGSITQTGMYTADTSENDVAVTASIPLSGVTLSGTSLVQKRRVVAITLTPSSASLATGAAQQFAALGVRNSGDTVPVNASYSATGGTINSSGLFTAGSAAGTYRVIASDNRHRLADTSVVTVMTVPAAPVASVTISPNPVALGVGSTALLSATPRDSAGNPLTGRTISWSSSAPGVATVSANGLVTGVAAGSVTITATSEGISGTAVVAVTDVTVEPVATVSVAPTSATLRMGTTVQLTATLRDSGGNVLTGRSITWISAVPSVATVSATGLVSGVAAGGATITATSEGKSGTAAVTVTVVPVATVTVSPNPASVLVGGTTQLVAALRDTAGNLLTGRAISWTSSASGVATVSASGLVTGVSAGNATLTATSEGKSGTAAVTVALQTAHAGYYVSPNGSIAGDGTATRPWDLVTALAGAGGRIKPGDTVWVRGGTYRGAFASNLRGTATAPIVVRQYPGERATIDVNGFTNDALTVTGSYGIYWGFEIMNSSPDRTTVTPQRPHGVVNDGSHNKYVNLVVHDNGIGFYNYSSAADIEIYGCLVYNNGWQATKGSGHALYIKSDAGPIYLRDNILFAQFAYGVHVYTNAGSGHLNNVHVEGNVSFNNGTVSAAGASAAGANILMGGQEPVQNSTMIGNMTYFSPGFGVYNVDLGFETTLNADLLVQGNYIAGGRRLFEVLYWQSLTLSGNTLVAPERPVVLNDANTTGQQWSGDMHYRDPNAAAWQYGGRDYTFSEWRTKTGLGSTDQALSGVPTTRVFVRRNMYEPGRAAVVVYNWSRQSAVSADLSGILQVGDRYEVRNAQNFFGSPVASGTYGGGMISVPMGGVTPPTPIGGSATAPPKTGPDFDVFVVVRVSP